MKEVKITIFKNSEQVDQLTQMVESFEVEEELYNIAEDILHDIVRKEGSDRATKNFERKQDAVKYAREKLRQDQPSQVKI